MTGFDRDEIYGDLLEAFAGLSDEQHQQMSAALLIALSEQVADRTAILDAIGMARKSMEISR